jgi:hypothetical protein
MVYILLLLTCLCSAIMDNVMAHDSFAKWGIFFSRNGWQVKYQLTEWFNKFLPLWLSKFLAQDVLVIGTDIFHLAKSTMIMLFCVAIFGFCWTTFLAWLGWGVVFNVFYYITK